MNNQPPHNWDPHQSQMSNSQSYAAQPATAGGIPQYAHYQQHQQMMHPSSGAYAPSSGSYGHYAYGNGVTSPPGSAQSVSASMSSQMNSQLLPLPAMATGASSQHYVAGVGGPAQTYPQSFDTSGQVAPAGMKPRVTATLWEDEGSMCFQVEAKGVCVARRDDNHMINGTKLLNVAGMTRGRRDGILKSEKMRHVVKIGPMHLKGVWIPFERALDFANKEKITESLYPLFVHNIGALLYHPTNSTRTNAVMAAAERRKADQRAQQGGILAGSGTQPPSLHHHHSMSNSIAQPPHSIAPHPGSARPGIDRAHTFPTPPTSASSIIGNQGASYEWGQQSLPGGVQGAQPLSIDTGLTNARSMPTTPATTPPGTSMQTMQQQQQYDNSRSMYSSAPSQQGQYAQQSVQQQNMARFGQPMQSNQYVKSEMGPPSSRSIPEAEHGDHKTEVYAHAPGNEQVSHGAGEEEAEHEHDTEYPHDNNTAYSAGRGSYSYSSGPALGSLHGEHPHLSPEMTGSPRPNGVSRVASRNSSAGQAQWAAGYHTPPRAPSSSNLYNVISDARGTAPNGNTSADGYAATTMQSTYAPTAVNGVSPSNKRLRDEDDADQQSRPASRGADLEGLKRRKTTRDNSMSVPAGASSYDRDGRPVGRLRNSTGQRRR